MILSILFLERSFKNHFNEFLIMTHFKTIEDLLALPDKKWPSDLDVTRTELAQMTKEEKEDFEYWLPYSSRCKKVKQKEETFSDKEMIGMDSFFVMQIPIVGSAHEGMHAATSAALGGKPEVVSYWPTITNKSLYFVGGQTYINAPNQLAEIIAGIVPDFVVTTLGFVFYNKFRAAEKGKNKILWGGLSAIYLVGITESMLHGDMYQVAGMISQSNTGLVSVGVAAGVVAGGYATSKGILKAVDLAKKSEAKPQKEAVSATD